MDRLKVLFITWWYPTKEQPVQGVFVREHAKAVQLYDEVVVLHLAGWKPDLKGLWKMEEESDRNLTQSIPTYRLCYRPSPIPKTSYFIYVWSVLQAFRGIVHEGFHPDIIHAHVYPAGVPAAIAAKLYRLPLVATEHHTRFPMEELSLTDIIAANVTFMFANRVLAVSRFLLQAIRRHSIRANVEVVPNVVDTKVFYPKKANPDNGGVKHIICVGVLSHPRKGFEHLLRAVASLRQQRSDFHLEVVGSGPYEERCAAFARDLEVEDFVTFHGRLAREDLAHLLRQSDFFVLPSVFENFSVATAEALATGTPVLATRCGGPEEFLTDDVGALVAPGDPEALCTGLSHMLDDLERFSPDRISRYATERLSPQRVGGQLHAIYQEVSASRFAVFRAGYSGHRIAISRGWRVLDLGSGHNPHRRANVLLDRSLLPSAHRSGRPAVRDGRPFIVGDAQRLPFEDQSFDYIIASHLAEHVADPLAFCEELTRVGRRGYIECLSPLAERLLGETVHLWVVRQEADSLIFETKSDSNRLLGWISDGFYALFYAGQDRNRRTFNPTSKVARAALVRLRSLIVKAWCSPLLRRWTYTCFEFDGHFGVRVYSTDEVIGS